MISYIHRFNTEQEFDAKYNGDGYREPWVSAINDGNISYNKNEYETLLETPLTFEILSSGAISWRVSGSTDFKRTIEYKINSGEWTTVTSEFENNSVPPLNIEVVSGDIIQFRGNNTEYGNDSGSYNYFFSNNAQFNIKGNIMSLINSINFKTITTLESNFTFIRLFEKCTGVINSNKLILPSIILSRGCYKAMFSECENLITTPNLPATQLAYGCYEKMFNKCTSLTKAPELPATQLSTVCYDTMFFGCTSLIEAPALPATELENTCYRWMFYYCENLVTAPELPAETIPYRAYEGMFNSCTKLQYIKCLATQLRECSGWLSNVSSTGTFVKNPSMTTWTTGTSGIPEGWTVQDAS